MDKETSLKYHDDIKAIRRSLTDLEFALVTRNAGERDIDSAVIYIGHIEQTCCNIANRLQGID